MLRFGLSVFGFSGCHRECLAQTGCPSLKRERSNPLRLRFRLGQTTAGSALAGQKKDAIHLRAVGAPLSRTGTNSLTSFPSGNPKRRTLPSSPATASALPSGRNARANTEQ